MPEKKTAKNGLDLVFQAPYFLSSTLSGLSPINSVMNKPSSRTQTCFDSQLKVSISPKGDETSFISCTNKKSDDKILSFIERKSPGPSF